MFYFFNISLSPVLLTGYAVANDTGIVSIDVQDSRSVTIYSPLNQTYYFNVSDPYILSLNVSANFAASSWKYSLYRLDNNSWVYVDIPFSPNSSITAVIGGNLLTVSAFEAGVGWVNKTVIFTVSLPNNEPQLGYIPDDIYVCEGESLYHPFNATDIDNEVLSHDISPKNPFFTRYLTRVGIVNYFSIISGILDKADAGEVVNGFWVYEEVVSVVDGELDSDSALTNITVIGVNNPPNMVGLGAQTVWLAGENSSFDHQMDVSDVEDGVSSGGDFVFNLTFGGAANLFTIDNYGVMNYTPIAAELGIYSIEVCVQDNPLPIYHENISLCSSGDNESISVCDNFTLTVTNVNRPPEIVDYFPNGSLFTSGASAVFLNVTVSDPDGTIPDIDWYVDDVLIEHNENISFDNFTHVFGCGVSGLHYMKIITTDGVLSDFYTWNVSVSYVACPEPPSGGGGGGGAEYCFEDWVCDDWDVCHSVLSAFAVKSITQEDHLYWIEICNQNGYHGVLCGFQMKQCYDINYCNNSVPIIPVPVESQVCHYTSNPSCSDGIKNCHDGACELLVDCGGPCEICPTCDDGVQNQGEFGVDCGGPCPYQCPVETPMGIYGFIFVILIILLLIILLIVLYRVIKIMRNREVVMKRRLQTIPVNSGYRLSRSS